MSSREAKKQLRREQRLAQEAAAAKVAARKRRLTTVGVVVLSLAAIAGVVIAVVAGSGGGSGPSASANGAAPPVAIPQQQSHDLTASAAAAGCQQRDFQSFGQEHTTAKVTYKSNPPTSGPHNPVPADDGSYSAANPPGVGNTVHALEHGRVEIQWRPGLPRREIGQLQTLFKERDGYHTLLFANQSAMPYEVAISSWQHYLGCRRFTPKVFDAIRNFRETYTDKGPEFVP